MMNNHKSTKTKKKSYNVRMFKCEAYDFKSIDIAEIEAYIKEKNKKALLF